MKDIIKSNIVYSVFFAIIFLFLLLLVLDEYKLTEVYRDFNFSRLHILILSTLLMISILMIIFHRIRHLSYKCKSDRILIILKSINSDHKKMVIPSIVNYMIENQEEINIIKSELDIEFFGFDYQDYCDEEIAKCAKIISSEANSVQKDTTFSDSNKIVLTIKQLNERFEGLTEVKCHF